MRSHHRSQRSAPDESLSPVPSRLDGKLGRDHWRDASFHAERPPPSGRKAAPRFRLWSARKGLGAGRGFIPLEFAGAPEKRGRRQQSTGRRLSSVFGVRLCPGGFGHLGQAALSVAHEPEIEGIDDPNSRYYNKLVDRSKVAKVDWAVPNRCGGTTISTSGASWSNIIPLRYREAGRAFSCTSGKSFDADDWLHGDVGAESGAIAALARSRARSDSDSDAASGVSLDASEIRLAVDYGLRWQAKRETLWVALLQITRTRLSDTAERERATQHRGVRPKRRRRSALPAHSIALCFARTLLP